MTEKIYVELGLTFETEEGSRNFAKVTIGGERNVEPGTDLLDAEKELFRELQQVIFKRARSMKRNVEKYLDA